MSFDTQKIPGILLCLFIAIPAWVLGQALPLIGAPVFAILLGMVVGHFHTKREKTQQGIAYTSKMILQLAVVLLGFGLNLGQVVSVGLTSLPIILATISVALIVAFVLQKAFKLEVNTATLVGVGSSICGGSAIAATAPVIGAKDEEVAQSISVIFLFNILAALLFPTLGQMLGLSHEGFALFAGTAVNDTSSVTATATAWDAIHQSHTLDGATIVKLTRTLAIIPITLALSWYKSSKGLENGGASQSGFRLKKVFPTFILYFLAASLITTVVAAFGGQTALFGHLKTLSKLFIVMAMSGIGLNTNPIRLVKTGGAICWLAITLTSLAMQAVIGVW